MDDDIATVLDFERDLEQYAAERQPRPPAMPPVGDVGQQPRNFMRNYKQTVCTFWLKGGCMKGNDCSFLHEYVKDKLPECTNFLKFGVCNDPECKLKHSIEDVKECNMYALGFCIYGPSCRFKHTRKPGPPPHPSTVEACKPKQFRDINKVLNTVNDNVAVDFAPKRPRLLAAHRNIAGDDAATPSGPPSQPPALPSVSGPGSAASGPRPASGNLGPQGGPQNGRWPEPPLGLRAPSGPRAPGPNPGGMMPRPHGMRPPGQGGPMHGPRPGMPGMGMRPGMPGPGQLPSPRFGFPGQRPIRPGGDLPSAHVGYRPY